MKRYLSSAAPAVLGTLYKFIALLAAMAAAQLGAFLLARSASPGATLEETIKLSRVGVIFALAFLALAALLCLTGSERGGARERYTLSRLRVSERAVTLCWGLYYACCFLILWAAEAALLLFLCRYFAARADVSLASGQTVFLAFYRSPFLHSLLPLEEGSRWARNIVMALSLGLSCSAYSARARRDERGVAAIVLSAFALWGFAGSLGRGDTDFIMMLLFAVISGFAIAGVWGRDEHDA